MKKKIVVGLLALTILIGVTGTLSYKQNMQLAAQERQLTGKPTVAVKLKEDQTEPPKIEGQKDWDVTQGETINVLTDVIAKDHDNKTIPVVASTFSTEKTGDQNVTLTAVDQEHNQTTETITVHVKKAIELTTTPSEEIANSDNQAVIDAPIEEETIAEPVLITETAIEEQPVAVPSEPTWAANTMYVGGISIPYQNAGQGGGQSVIDNNPNVIATWGGNAVQSGNDGANTHFIGHNPGIFNILFSVSGGNQIIVTDTSGTPTYYTVNQIFQVDDYATGVVDGQSYADQIIGSGGGERITLQTCVNDDINLIIMASTA